MFKHKQTVTVGNVREGLRHYFHVDIFSYLPNGLRLSREQRESYMTISRFRTRCSSVCSRLLCRVRGWDLKIATNLDDKNVVDLSVSRYRRCLTLRAVHVNRVVAALAE